MSNTPRPKLTINGLKQLASNPQFQGILLRLRLCEAHVTRERAREHGAISAEDPRPALIAESKYLQVENELIAFALPVLGVAADPGSLSLPIRSELIHVLIGIGCAVALPGND